MESGTKQAFYPKTLRLTLGLVAWVAFAPSTRAQHYMFGRADFPTGVSPQSVATADFNADGLMDLAVANANDNTVSILLGKPDGTFAAKVDYPVGTAPRMVVVADFNQDGKPDLAAVNSGSNSISVLLGKGDGTFQAHVDYPAGSGAVWLAAADFNHDGKVDLTAANPGANTVSVLLGNGDGTFQSQVDYATGPQPSSVAVADFNGDGKPDLAVANANCISTPCGPGSVSVLLGNGDGTFQTHVEHNAGAGPSAVAAVDFNGDGKADLAVANNADGTVSVLLGKGDGTFQPQQAEPAGAGPDWVAISDFNGDGKADLAVVNQTANTVSILLGNGDGTFQAKTDYYAGSEPRGIAVADFNGDGPLDVAIANSGSNTVSVLAGKGDGTLEHVVQYPLGDGAAISIATGDFNRDNKPDLAVTNQDCNPNCQPGPVSILLGNGDGSFEPHVDYPTGVGPTSVITGDFNKDGILDLALANYTANTVSILLGNGDGTFRPHVDYVTGQGPLAVTTGDFNNDGKPDLALAVDALFAVAGVLLGNGDGTLRPVESYSVGRLPKAAAVGDFNGDGKLDLAVANKNDNTVSILLGNGDGTFQSQVAYPVGNGPCSIVVADLNADGKLDLATANQFEGSVSVLIGNGDGTFKAQVKYPAGAVSLGITQGDFNSDGKPDLAVANGQSGSVSILPGNGDGTFQPHVDYATGSNTYPAAVTEADFTGAGGRDLAVATEVGVSVVLNSPVMAVFPRQLIFASQDVGTTSASQTVSLTNPSSEPLLIESTAASGDFAQTNTCGASLVIGASCTVTVTFTPAAAGTRTGTLTLTDAAASSPQRVSLTGTGSANGPGAALSPTNLTFGSQAVGTTSAPQAVTLNNSGNAALSITSISTSGDFSQTNNCGSSVATGANCAINVTFTPTAAGTRSGTLTVSDNAAGGPQTVSLSGAANVPVANLSPASLTFPSQALNSTSSAQTVTLSNTGGAALNLTSITASGDFAQTNTCGASLTSGAHCAVNVTFTPAATGTRTGTISISDNASGSPHTVSLKGTGGTSAPTASLSPSSLIFGSQNVGSSSAAQAITVSNTGNAALSITGITATGDFTQTNGCGATLAAGAHCAVNVVFAPTAAGTRSGTLSMVDNAAGSPHTASLAGSGQAAPTVSLSPSSLTFGNQAVGVTGTPQLVTLTNTGGASLTISSVTSISTSFVLTNNCATTLAAGANCTLSVTFKPASAGPWGGALLIADSAAGGMQAVTLNGTGVAPLASISPDALTFPVQAVASTSPAQSITLSNLGAAPLSITRMNTSGPAFNASSNCGASLAAGASCTISVTFTHTATGSTTGTLFLTDNATNSPQQISMAMAGSSSLVTVYPSAVTFGTQGLGTTSPPRTLTVTNESSAAVPLYGVSINTPSFAASSSCPGSLAAGASCSISVTFTPSSAASLSGTLTLTHGATNNPQTVSLWGSGTGPALAFSTPALNFGTQTLGSPSPPQIVAMANVGGAAVTVTSISAGGDFSQTNNCPTTLATGAICEASVTFTPAATGTRSGTFTVVDNAAGGSQSVSLTGSGTSTAPPAGASLVPSNLSFSSVTVGSSSPTQAVTVTNTGGSPLAVSSISTSGDFGQTNNCGATLAAGASCQASVTFRPTVAGARGGTLAVADNAAGSPQSVSLSGTGTSPASASLTPSTLNFGSVNTGSHSGSQGVVLSNTGGSALTVASISASGDFGQTNNCGATLAAGANCQANVTFTPTATGTRSGTLTVTDNAAGGSQSVGLSGTGTSTATPAAASLSPSTLSFGSVPVGSRSSSLAVVLANTGGSPLAVSSVASTSGSFSQTNNCGSAVAAGANCTINVLFQPSAQGALNASVVVTDNAAGSPHSAAATGTGTLTAATTATLSASSLIFGNQSTNTMSAAKNVTLTNTGRSSLTVSSVKTSGDFLQSNMCMIPIAPNASCTIRVFFAPTLLGVRAGTLTINDNAAGSPRTVSLSGTGIL